MSDLEFKNGNPGAVKFGNFINYYKFHPPEDRIKLLPDNIWNYNSAKFVALDIGCNAGDLTVSLHEFLQGRVNNPKILAIDIDPVLIERANTFKNEDLTFSCLDIMDEVKRRDVLGTYLTKENVKEFSAVFCFSTTMWIHLNHGDDGLWTFLKYISGLSNMLVVEPQPWKCYKTAVKRMKNTCAFSSFPQLKYRENIEDSIVEYLISECSLEVISESDRTNWDRKVIVFRKRGEFTLLPL